MKNSIFILAKSILHVLAFSAMLNSCGSESQQTKQEPPTTETSEPAPTAGSTANLKLDSEHFGSFDLSTWEKMPVENDEEEGDVKVETVMYKKDGVTMAIDTSRSEYYYSIRYTLKDSNGKVQKSRELHFDNDAKELTESHTALQKVFSPARAAMNEPN